MARVTSFARAAREWSGWIVASAGAVLCVLGWYGVSGESLAEQQLPYLASATIPGAALIVAGAVLAALRPARRSEVADRRMETLYALLVTDADSESAEVGAVTPPPEASDESTVLLAVPGGTLYHRRDCPLVADKPAAVPVDLAALERPLSPCPVCDPPPLPPTAPPTAPSAEAEDP